MVLCASSVDEIEMLAKGDANVEHVGLLSFKNYSLVISSSEMLTNRRSTQVQT